MKADSYFKAAKAECLKKNVLGVKVVRYMSSRSVGTSELWDAIDYIGCEAAEVLPDGRVIIAVKRLGTIGDLDDLVDKVSSFDSFLSSQIKDLCKIIDESIYLGIDFIEIE
jgi:hypothetical protein